MDKSMSMDRITYSSTEDDAVGVGLPPVDELTDPEDDGDAASSPLPSPLSSRFPKTSDARSKLTRKRIDD